MAVLNRSIFATWAKHIFLWMAPCLLLAQYVGNFPKKPILVTSVYLAVLAGALWLGPPELRSDTDEESWVGWRIVGGVFVACGAAVMVVGVLRIFGFEFVTQHFQRPEWWAQKPGRILLPTLAAWPLAVGLPLVRGRRVEPRDYVRLGALAAIPLLCLLAAGVHYQGMEILPKSDLTTQILAAVAAVVLVAVAALPAKKPGIALGGLLLVGLLLRARGLWTWQIDPGMRDMLALVQSAHDSLFAGENPYQIHQMQQGSQVPLTYLPGLWLLYMTPDLLGLDIRWMGLVADAAVVASLWWVATGSARSGEDEVGWPRAAAVSLGAIWLFLPSVHWNGIYAEPHLWWGVLALWLASVLRQRWWVAAALTGLAVATRHFSVVVLPFVLITLVRSLGWRRAVPRVALAGTVAALILVPFIAADPHTFWFGTLEWLREYGPAHQKWFTNSLGFSGPMYKADASHLMLPIQLSAVAVLALAHAVVPRRPESEGRFFIAFAGMAYALFVTFNGIIWYSFYLGVFVFVAIGLSYTADRGPGDEPEPTLSGAWWKASAVVAALSVAAGGWIATTLYQFYSQNGLDGVTERLASELEPDDLLVDRTQRQLEFVDERGLEHLSTGATVSYDIFAGNLLLRRRTQDVWVAARTAWNAAFIDRVSGLGEVHSRERFGHYTLMKVDVGPVRTRLSRRLDVLKPSWRRRGQTKAHDYQKKRRKKGPVWKASGLPSWVKVKPRQCKIGPLRETLLYAHPFADAYVDLNWSDLKLGRSLLLYGGIRNPVVTWGRSDVHVDLFVDGEHQRRLVLENRPGPWWESIDTSEWQGERHDLMLELTAANDGKRWACVEGVVLGPAEAP